MKTEKSDNIRVHWNVYLSTVFAGMQIWNCIWTYSNLFPSLSTWKTLGIYKTIFAAGRQFNEIPVETSYHTKLFFFSCLSAIVTLYCKFCHAWKVFICFTCQFSCALHAYVMCLEISLICICLFADWNALSLRYGGRG